MSHTKVLGKSVLLFILIIIVALFGVIWFDFLGLIQAKKIVAPVYKLVGLTPVTSDAASSPGNLAEADLDNDRFAKRLESLDVRIEELDKRESDIREQEENNAQIAQELQDRQTAQEEREKTFNNEKKKADERDRNIQQIVANLNGMQPVKAVAIIEAMDDQDVIDVLRCAEKVAAAEGTSSMGAYWLSLLPADRAAEIQRKMANKPTSLD
ncbi:MAG: flagellar protein FlbB [Treponema sp.]|nr:flagellar protein FlbB [Treponema sp.]